MNEHENSSLDFGGLKISLVGPQWLQFVEVLAVVGFFFWSMGWICSDAKLRGKSGFLAFIFLFAASWPLSLLWWLWLRPPLLRSEITPLPVASVPPPPPPPPVPVPSTNPP